MKPAFEISRVGVGLSIVLLNRAAALLVAATLGTIKEGVKFTNKDRGLITSLKKDTEYIFLVMDDAQANRFCDLLEMGLDSGLRLEPMVYALGERLAHRLSPGCYFGVKRRAA